MDNLRTKQEHRLHNQIKELDLTPEQAAEVVGGWASPWGQGRGDHGPPIPRPNRIPRPSRDALVATASFPPPTVRPVHIGYEAGNHGLTPVGLVAVRRPTPTGDQREPDDSCLVID